MEASPVRPLSFSRIANPGQSSAPASKEKKTPGCHVLPGNLKNQTEHSNKE